MSRIPNLTGIMFDGNGERESFPLVSDTDNWDYGWYRLINIIDGELFSDWRIIARDPRSQCYSDSDWEAMDETNWDALLENLSVAPVLVRDNIAGSSAELAHKSLSAYTHVTEGVADALEAGIAIIDQCLVIAPGMDEDLETMGDMRKALSDYPLLDEEAYSEREYEAWMEYAPDALRDELRDADDLDENTADMIYDDAEELSGWLSSDMHYTEGFGGGYAPNFLDIIALKLTLPFVFNHGGEVKYYA